ncbi:MAG: hypothetical protein ABEK00_00375 [Candidatus Nanohaloarchaea archaeon]
MVKFEEEALTREDHYFLDEDPARIYRGLKDLLVDEFDMDRIEEAKNEFNVSGPKDKINIHAFKEKSPNTVLYFNLSWRVQSPDDIYTMGDRPDDIHQARVKTTGKVVTVYPGGSSDVNTPEPLSEDIGNYDKSHLADSKSRFQRSKFYEILVGTWYHRFYYSEIEKYEEEAAQIVIRIQNLMRERFGVEDGIARTAGSGYRPPWK